MKRVNLIILLLCGSFLMFTSSCSDDPIGIDEHKEIWPLEKGNLWKYNIKEPSYITDDLNMEILDTIRIEYAGKNYTVYKQVTYFEGTSKPNIHHLYWNGPEGTYYMGAITDNDTLLIKSLAYKYPAEIGDSWERLVIDYSNPAEKFYIADTLTFSLIDKGVKYQSEIGDFNCYLYEFQGYPSPDIPTNWRFKYYLSPGNGIVGRLTTSDLDNSVKQDYSLIEYKIN